MEILNISPLPNPLHLGHSSLFTVFTRMVNLRVFTKENNTKIPDLLEFKNIYCYHLNYISTQFNNPVYNYTWSAKTYKCFFLNGEFVYTRDWPDIALSKLFFPLNC